MNEPTEPGYYWIHIQGSRVNKSSNTTSTWERAEIACWNGKDWDVIGREYAYSTADLNLVGWIGPILPPAEYAKLEIG